MSDFQAFLEYLKSCEGYAVWLVAMALVEALPRCAKWLAVAIRGYRGVEQVYITASEGGDEEELDGMDEDELKERARQLKAALINLQSKLDALVKGKGAKG